MNLETSAIPDGEFSPKFLQGMMNRIVVGYHRYKGWKNSRRNGIDFIKCMKDRIRLYEENGNTEYLMDVGNFAMAEFLHPSVDGAFFESTSKSPGVIDYDGKRVFVSGE